MSIISPVFCVDRTPESVLVPPYVTTVGAAFNVIEGGAAATGAAHIAASMKIGNAFLIELSPFVSSTGNIPYFQEIHAPCYDSSMHALITGGTGRIGRAIGIRLESEGWSVVSAGRADGDVSRPVEAKALVERAASELGGLDLLVNAASEGFALKAV